MTQAPLAWRMVALGFLAQNLATGLAALGPFVIPFSESFGVSRAMASAGDSIIVFTFLGSGPWVGGLIRKHEIRNVMTAGAALMVTGFGLLSMAQSAWMILLFCPLLGLGCALLGPLPAMALMANWFESGRGRATGIVLMPLGQVITPIVTTFLIEHFGWRAAFGCLAALLFAAMPVLRLVRDRPSDRVAPLGEERTVASESLWSINRRYLGDVEFWILAVAAALILSANPAFGTHAIAYARGLGVEPQAASFVLATWSAAAMVGSFAFGWLCDRLGAAVTLAANAATQIALWLMLWHGGSLGYLLATSALIGICAGGSIPALCTLLSVRYGAENFSHAMALAMLIQVPMLAGAPLLMGFLFDVTGSYGTAFLVHVSLFAVAAAVFIRYARTTARVVPART